MTPDLIPVIEAAGAALLALIAAAVALGIRWLHSKIQIAIVNRALTAVSQACHLAVTQTWTTYVEGLKAASADGTLSDEEKSAALDKAVEFAKGFLGPRGIALIVDGLGIESDWVDAFLGASVESSLADLRRTERSVRPSDSEAKQTAEAVPVDPLTASAQA